MSDKIKLPRTREYPVTIENAALRLLLASFSETAENETGDISDLTMHSHFYTEIFVCTEGAITVNTNSGAFTLNSGDAAIIPIGMPHNKLPSAGHVCWRSIAFTCDHRQEKDCYDLFSDLKRMSAGSSAVIFRGIPDVCREFTVICSHPTDSDCYFALHMAGIITSLYEIYRDMGVTSSHKANSDNSVINRLSQLDQLLNTCFMNDISVSDIAQKLFVSKRQLTRIAVRRYGMTLHRAIIDKRITTAERMLRTTAAPTDSIAGIVGFGSKSGFYREFTKKYAVTPAKYRKNKCR
jgi:AraC-like DNA-binding protein